MRVFKVKHSGFTIIEIMVVMAIMAVLVTLTASALKSANNENVVEETTQNLLSQIREAQNRAMGVSGVGGNKVWAVEIKKNGTDYGFNLVNYQNVSGTTLSIGGTLARYSDKRVKIMTSIDSGGTSDNAYLAYSSPFSRFYGTIDSNGCISGVNCEWNKSVRYEEDWEAVEKSGSGYDDMIGLNKNPDRAMRILLSFNNGSGQPSRVIVVLSSGDAYIE